MEGKWEKLFRFPYVKRPDDTNTQYSLTLILELEGEQKVYYYTTILWNDDVHISEILEFATDFHGNYTTRKWPRN